LKYFEKYLKYEISSALKSPSLFVEIECSSSTFVSTFYEVLADMDVYSRAMDIESLAVDMELGSCSVDDFVSTDDASKVLIIKNLAGDSVKLQERWNKLLGKLMSSKGGTKIFVFNFNNENICLPVAYSCKIQEPYLFDSVDVQNCINESFSSGVLKEGVFTSKRLLLSKKLILESCDLLVGLRFSEIENILHILHQKNLVYSNAFIDLDNCNVASAFKTYKEAVAKYKKETRFSKNALNIYTIADLAGVVRPIGHNLLDEFVEDLLLPSLNSEDKDLRHSGILFLGDAGTGKSQYCKYIAKHAESNLFQLSMEKLYSKFLGDSEKQLKDALELAERSIPSIIWIDEIDKCFVGYGEDNTGVASRLLGILLTWLQENHNRVLLLATANNISEKKIPLELFRPGRFDRIYRFSPLKQSDIKEIMRSYFKLYLEYVPVNEFKEKKIAGVEPSGAELEQLIKDVYRTYKLKDTSATAVFDEKVDLFISQKKSKKKDSAENKVESNESLPFIIYPTN
jgi:hypothetical protein